MKKTLLSLMLIFFLTQAFSQEKNTELKQVGLKIETIEKIQASDEETNKELKEARGNFVHWFKPINIDLIFQEDEQLYKMKEVELVEVNIKNKNIFSIEEEEEMPNIAK